MGISDIYHSPVRQLRADSPHLSATEVQKIREQQLLAELAREREAHRTHERFINQITYGACTPQGDAMTRADEQLMSQLITRVRENLTDANYNVEALAAAMNMSRSSLHRKIKALTDLSPLDFIRVIRLKRAAELFAGRRITHQ